MNANQLRITPHGRTFPSGLSVFTCLINGTLQTFRTDQRGRNAKRAAREYFAGQAGATFGPINLSDLYCSDPVKACRLALRRTINVPENDRLEAINALLGMHGTEAIRGEWQNGYWCDIVAAYCNTGDTYAVTVLQERGEFGFSSSRFLVCSWGDWVESYERKHGQGSLA